MVTMPAAARASARHQAPTAMTCAAMQAQVVAHSRLLFAPWATLHVRTGMKTSVIAAKTSTCKATAHYEGAACRMVRIKRPKSRGSAREITRLVARETCTQHAISTLHPPPSQSESMVAITPLEARWAGEEWLELVRLWQVDGLESLETRGRSAGSMHTTLKLHQHIL